jgi:uncharacterized protein
MTAQDNLELVRRGYAAFVAGDMDALLELFSPDIVQTVPGSSPLAGSHKGAENVLALYGQLFERSGGTLRVELEDVMSDGGDRVISVHQVTAERNGQTYSAREALVFTIVDGKVAEMQDFFTDIEASDSFWS